MQVLFATGKSPVHGHDLNSLPKIRIEDSRYLVRFAENVEEFEAALKLRFEVFNLELGEGLDSSFRTGRDRDEFDATCYHLIVIEKSTDRIVGTYRLRTMAMAKSAGGFYSAVEFDLSCLPFDLLYQSVELGRACIAREHRERRVLFLLWKALAHYALSHRKRFLFGCCSLTSQQPHEGRQLLAQLSKAGHMHQTLWVLPRPGFECLVNGSANPGSSAAELGLEEWPRSATPAGLVEPKLPKLFKTYLEIGAKVCGPPAIDRAFKTIDFFVMLDMRAISARTRKLLFDKL